MPYWLSEMCFAISVGLSLDREDILYLSSIKGACCKKKKKADVKTGLSRLDHKSDEGSE